MFKLKLIKGLSYNGIVSATAKNPYITVDDEKIALAAVDTGYFKIVEKPEKGNDGQNNNGGQADDGANKEEPKDWKQFNKDDLIAFANEHNIDVSSCKNQSERIAIIEAALADDGEIDSLFE